VTASKRKSAKKCGFFFEQNKLKEGLDLCGDWCLIEAGLKLDFGQI
jgi:hypothetical protein